MSVLRKDQAENIYDDRMLSYGDVLSRRGISPGEECPRCQGFGGYVYGSGSTWRGGIGGATMTYDVCDKCWGSGSKTRPWKSWRLK